ncbi:MAG: T9SS type A sorting domain-containing protein [Bacteroidales bacterium]|nr:T9SS type A sorting domain-containing protein [Bacteroidales bacterium]
MKVMLFLPAMLLAGSICLGQSVTFDYDDSGNRTQRTITLKSTTSPDKQNDPQEGQELFSGELGTFDILIYPNPVRNELIVEISGSEEPSAASVHVFDQKGRLVRSEENVTETAILYLGDLMPGNYFMVIRCGNRSASWKIIKE